jgi:hypothetical protein
MVMQSELYDTLHLHQKIHKYTKRYGGPVEMP